MKIHLPGWSEQDDPSQSWAEKWKRRCSHQFVVKALVTTSPNGFVTVTDITLAIAVQNFFFSQSGISSSEIVISVTTSTDFAIRFSQFSTINSDAEKWEEKPSIAKGTPLRISVGILPLFRVKIEYCTASNSLPRANWQSFIFHLKTSPPNV